VRLPNTLYLIFELAVALGQLPDDDIRTAGHVNRSLKKYGVTNFEFVDRHGAVHLAHSKAAGALRTDGSALRRSA